ncbi:hypothetical protein PC9H_005042 [Pleurotus ostreatus]|uniref:HMG box domain-containing protein n=2 Tax=Pleurotus TaxID=5320 RepID=A0A8H6ZYC0_PLEOS|nr:uncharacterized protein PC9H_005042 [Pleurotus ostreatus]KAF7433094.1 hypothetical protein PC9H_005042 [Pleurotus ostreatus]
MEPSTSHSVQSSGSGALAPLMSPYMSSSQSMDQTPSPASSLPDCADATPCLGQGVFSLQPFSLPDTPSTPKPKRVPRPANAFMLFRSDFLRSGTVPSEVERKQQTLSKLAGKIWESMDEDEKSKWRNKAEKVKDEHRRAHPDYKFTPMRGPARLKARGQTDERGQDRNGEGWIEELRLRYAPPTPPGRPLKGRGHRKHQPTISPKLEYPPEQLSPMAISPTPSPSLSSNPSYFPPPVGMLPRRPSSAPGLRPSSIPMECDYKPPACTGLETRPIHPFQLHPQDHRFLPRRPSTATGGRTSQEAMNYGAYALPSPIHFHDPFTAQPVNALGQNMASLHIGDTLPAFTHESVSPLDARHMSQYHLSNGLHFPNTTFPNATSPNATFPNATSPNATSPLTPGMQVDFASKQDEGTYQYANTQKPRFEAGAFAGVVYSQDGYAHHPALLPPYVPGAYSHYGNVNSESDYSMHYGSPQ